MAARKPDLAAFAKAARLAAERPTKPASASQLPASIPQPAAPAAPTPPQRSRALTDASATTAIHIPRDDLALLRRVAVERANRGGGRPSVSDVLRELIERHRAELEAEAAR